MPVEIEIDQEKKKLYPTEEWQKMPINTDQIVLDRDYYVDSNQLK